MQSHPKVLLSTVWRDGPLYDFWGYHTPRTPFRLGGKLVVSFGLRFIRHNLPGIEILENPTAREYRRALARGWDIVGISFYLSETRRALDMAAEARHAGAAEVWGGNYGVLTPEVRPHFDRVFVGYAEHQIAEALGIKLERLVHPPMVVPFGVPFWKIVRLGLLFTTRGCCCGCTFCQTPVFAPKPCAIPLEEIDGVLKCYAEHGVFDILIPDENFGILPGHARAVGELLAKHGMLWTVMTRSDYLLQHFDEWRSQGLAGVMIGIESLAQDELNALNKRSNVEKLHEAVELCRRHGILMIGYYIIGLESDTEESIRASIENLAVMRFDLVALSILTPFPQTPLWQRLQECYGIDDQDYSHFDGKHLVWRHPALTKGQIENLLDWSFKRLYPPTSFATSFVKFVRAHARRVGRCRAVPYVAGNMLKLNLFPFRQLPSLPYDP
jgi:radical SAM superfamily enzyme YgiQ (UPF0313 family)